MSYAKGYHELRRYYLACGVTDLRRAVDGLAINVKQEFKMDPFENYLFLFCNRARNRPKALSRIRKVLS
ncbi:IS66 family insertion sequence element accessory protein TnpB [Desulfosporosinus shakirovi]|uniref:IS66 family insertion sequence element accessory protein TnpB n=1 Tax=Desulfosporosinus shakirovi TaxID=2885154 RepID=UPI0037C037A5|nr:IS66 family insertion sequence element accessory protein TnpB [Desulfosporosinus sp. SRJS8]